MKPRPTLKLVAVLFFYLLLAAIVAVASSSIGVLAYPLIIVFSLLFILALKLKVRVKGFLAGLTAAVISMGLVVAVLLLSGAVRVESLSGQYALMLLQGAVLESFVGFGEELSFRAALFQGLSDELGFAPAVVLSSAGFAAMHLPSMALLGVSWPSALIAVATIFTAGMALSMLYAFGGIYNAVAFHTAWNFIEYNLFGLGPMAGAIIVSKHGPDILTGGAFGPEASVEALAVTIALAIALWVYYRGRKSPSQMAQD